MKAIFLINCIFSAAFNGSAHADGPLFSVYKWSQEYLNNISGVVSTDSVIAGIDFCCKVKVRVGSKTNWDFLGKGCAEKLYIKNVQGDTFLFQIEKETGFLFYAKLSKSSAFWSDFKIIYNQPVKELYAEINFSKKVSDFLNSLPCL